MMLWAVFITCLGVLTFVGGVGPKVSGSFWLHGSRRLSPGGYAASTVGANFSLVTAVVVLMYFGYAYDNIQNAITIFSGAFGVAILSTAAGKLSPVSACVFDSDSTIHSYISEAYGSAPIVRRVCALVTIIGLIGFASVATFTYSAIFSQILNVPPLVPAILSLGAVSFYVARRGFDGVIKTDKLQLSAIALVLIGLFVAVIDAEVDSPFTFWRLLDDSSMTNLGGFVLLVIVLTNTLYHIGSAEAWVRLVAVGESKAQGRGAVVAGIMFLCFLMAIMFFGRLIRFVHVQDGIQLAAGGVELIVWLINTSPFVSAILVVGLCFAFLSTVDTMIFSVGSTIVTDVGGAKNSEWLSPRYITVTISSVILFVVWAVNKVPNVDLNSFLFMVFSYQIILVPLVLFRTIVGPRASAKPVGGLMALIIPLTVTLVLGISLLPIAEAGGLMPLVAFVFTSVLILVFPILRRLHI